MSNPLEELYDYERLTINGLYLLMGILFLGLGLGELGIANPLTEFIQTYYIDPVANESTGDSGYNTINTMTYALVLSMFVIALSAWLRKLDIDGSDMTIIALFPFVFWAATGEVAEDARLFSEGLAPLFVSPGVHFQTAFWVVLAGFFGYMITHNAELSKEEKSSRIDDAAMMLIFAQFAIYASSVSSGVEGRGVDLLPLYIFSLGAFFTPLFLSTALEVFTDIQRIVYTTGLGGTMIFLGALLSFGVSVPFSQLTLWPLIVVLGIPALIIYAMHRYGSSAVLELSSSGLQAGILPPGVTEDDYLSSDSPDKDLIESLRVKAIMASPVASLAVAGQVLDGIATYIGIEHFGYSEKHVLSAKLIEIFGNTIGFTFVKAILAGVILYFFVLANFENRQRHLRLLIGLCFLVVGMAPGLRDVGRLALGV